MFSVHFEIELSKIGRMDLELFKFKSRHTKKHPVYSIIYIAPT